MYTINVEKLECGENVLLLAIGIFSTFSTYRALIMLRSNRVRVAGHIENRIALILKIFHLLGHGRKLGEQMEIREFMFVVSSHYPLTSCAIEEHYYNNIDAAKACFNELCAANPDVVVEFGIMTLCKNPCDDFYRSVKTRW